MLLSMKLTILIPTYNNASTLCDVVRRSVAVWPDVLVVDDGSTDDTRERLSQLQEEISFMIVSYPDNRGKGGALKAGFKEAKAKGYTHVLTLDADGQHFPEDAPALIEASRKQPEALIVGSRTFGDKNMPGGNVFANKFSNFWFTVQTLQSIPDTQTGYRLYPLDGVGGLRVLTARYEAELELLVFSAWRGTPLVPVPVRVYYPAPEERITHFRPTLDFLRITCLNTVLCFLAIVYGGPRMLFTKIKRSIFS